MSTYVFIRRDRETGKPVHVLAETRNMLGLVDEIGLSLERDRPDIYAKAFPSIGIGEVYLNTLDRDEFRAVYEATRSRYDSLVEKAHAEGGGDPVALAAWEEYLNALETDPRLGPGEE